MMNNFFFCINCRSFTARLNGESYTTSGKIRRSHSNRLFPQVQKIRQQRNKISPSEKYLNLVRKFELYSISINLFQKLLLYNTSYNSNIFLVAEEDAEEKIRSLKFDNLTSEEFDFCWKACSQHRLIEISTLDSTTAILEK